MRLQKVTKSRQSDMKVTAAEAHLGPCWAETGWGRPEGPRRCCFHCSPCLHCRRCCHWSGGEEEGGGAVRRHPVINSLILANYRAAAALAAMATPLWSTRCDRCHCGLGCTQRQSKTAAGVHVWDAAGSAQGPPLQGCANCRPTCASWASG